MNYRERQLRHILKQEQAKWDQEKDILQQDLVNLENSIDAQILAQEQTKNENLQKALDSLVEVLGKEDIHTLADLKNILHGETLKGLLALNQQKHNDLESQLLNLARRKITKQKQASELLKKLAENWTQKENEWDQEKAHLLNYQQAQREKLEKQKEENQQLLNNLHQEIKIKDQNLTKLAQELGQKEQELIEQKATYLSLRNKTSDLLAPFAHIPARALEDNHLFAQAEEVTEKLKQKELNLQEINKTLLDWKTKCSRAENKVTQKEVALSQANTKLFNQKNKLWDLIRKRENILTRTKNKWLEEMEKEKWIGMVITDCENSTKELEETVEEFYDALTDKKQEIKEEIELLKGVLD